MLSLAEWASPVGAVKSFNVRTEPAKVRHWKLVDRRRLVWMRAMRRQAASLFLAEGQDVATAFAERESPAAGLEAAEQAIGRGQTAWSRYYRNVYLTVGKDFANSTWRSLGQRGRVTGWARKAGLEDEWTRLVVNYVTVVGAQRVVGVSDTTKQAIREVVAEGIREGHTMHDIARSIRAAYGAFSGYRAERIARTEVVGASNAGSQMAAQVTGLVLNKEWISTRDERTRGADPKDEFDHVSVDGQVQPMGQPYVVSGEELQFPGDGQSGASAGNVINCRCVEGYFRPEDADPTEPTPSDEQPPVEAVPVEEPSTLDERLTAEAVSVEDLGGGVNVTFLVELENGERGVWKPQSGEGEFLRKYVPNGEQYLREALAYDVAKQVGMEDLVPVTVVRTVDGEVGSIQAFVEGAKAASKLRGRLGREEDRARIAVFDFIIGNSDRHEGNWMVHTKTNRVTLIDHGLAFQTDVQQYVLSRFIDWMGVDPIQKSLVAPYLEHRADILATVQAAVGEEAAAAVARRLDLIATSETWKEVRRFGGRFL